MTLPKNLLAVIVLATIMTPARSQSSPLQNRFPGPAADAGVASLPGDESFSIPTHWDSLPQPGKINWNSPSLKTNRFPIKGLVLPTAMIAYGFAALHSSHLLSFNRGVKEEIWTDNPHKKLGIDTYLMFAPGVMVYGLNLAGVHGKHDFKDRTILYLMSNLFANAAVFSLKNSTHTLRPDGSNYNSFPSGHTAEAFANAEFMRQEYKDVSPWYGLAGYAMATATGFLRIYNDKHWFNDVVAGAGFGMASTRLAYWLYPVLQRTFGKDHSLNTVVMPTYQEGSFGLALAHHF